MSKKQIICKGIFYYVAGICLLLLGIFLVGMPFVYFRGYTFIISTNYGWEAVRDYSLIMGMVFGVSEVPLLLYLIPYLIYMHKHPECKELRLLDYLKKLSFYIPIAVIAIVGIASLAYDYISGVIYDYTPTYTTEKTQEELGQGVFYEIPYSDELADIAGTVQIYRRGDIINTLSQYDKEENPRMDILLDYLFAPTMELSNFECIILPKHQGRVTNIDLVNSYMKSGTRTFKYEFDVETDSDSKEYLSMYIISTRYVSAYYIEDAEYHGIVAIRE